MRFSGSSQSGDFLVFKPDTFHPDPSRRLSRFSVFVVVGSLSIIFNHEGQTTSKHETAQTQPEQGGCVCAYAGKAGRGRVTF